GFILVVIDIIGIVIYKTFSKEAQLEKDKRDIANHILAYVNHEIRNPLNVIKGLTTLSLVALEDITKLVNDYKILNQMQQDITKVMLKDPDFAKYSDSTREVSQLLGQTQI